MTFRQIFIQDGRFVDSISALFHPQTTEFDLMQSRLHKCLFTIVNRMGEGTAARRVRNVWENMECLYGWILELEVEAMEDPVELIRKHRKAKLMYQQP